jgi:hypothetical protein
VSEPDFHIHENAAEYILFIWQTEDLARACNMDAEAVMQVIRAGNELSPEKAAQLENWYQGIIAKMQREGIVEKGHLAEVNDLMIELFYLHTTLLTAMADKAYQEMLVLAKPALDEYRARSELKNGNDVEVCLHALYLKILLKVRGVKISQATDDAMQLFAKIMAYLSKHYRLMKEGKMNFSLN